MTRKALSTFVNIVIDCALLLGGALAMRSTREHVYTTMCNISGAEVRRGMLWGRRHKCITRFCVALLDYPKLGHTSAHSGPP